MKRISKSFIAILFIALALVVVGCKKPVEDVKDPTLTLDKSTLTVEVGDEFTIQATVENLENGIVEYSFDKQGVVTLSNGKFIAEQAGTVVITASLKDYANIKESVTVTVNAPAPTLVTGVEVTGSTSMDEGSTQTLVATVSPENATNKEVEWTSSDSTVASVGNNGAVNALKAGSVTITATAKDGSGKSGSITITVTSSNVAVTGVSFSAAEKMYVGKTQNVYAIVTPNDATLKTVTWSSDNTSVLTVDSTGLITAVAAGSAKVTATANDGSGVSAETTITVVEFVAPEVTIVNPEWEFEELGSKVEYNGKSYEFGYDAYASLDEAIAAATKQTIVCPGEYPDDANIEKQGFTLVGPNATVDPNKANRTNEAIITGTISIAEGSKNITIKGFAFTTAGNISCNVGCENITVSYNNVYDTNTDVADWAEGRTQVEAVFSFWYSANTYEAAKNITITNNKFSNITETGILLARLTNVNVENNGFYNFKRDAVRGEGGYNWGDWVFVNNKFVNDELGSSNNALYLQSVSGADEAGVWQTITIKNNTFKNVGSSTSTSNYNAAIAWRTYQEKGLTVDISYNTFESCINYMNLRNNGATTTTYEANIMYNKFVGVPTTFYHKNLNGNDDTASNPLLTVMDYNLFLDSEGNVIATPDASKLLDLKEGSNANNYTSKDAYNDMIKALGGGYDLVVNKEFASLESGAEVEVEGITYKLGETAFGSISEAVAAASEGAKILVLAGIYDEDVTVATNNLELVGPNADIYAANTNRNAEATLGKVVAIGDGVKGFVLNGFEIGGAGQVTIATGCEDIKLVYNVINGATADGTYRVNGSVKNFEASYNYSNNQKAYRFLHIQTVENLTASYNYLTNENGTVAYDFMNVQKVIKGKVDIIGNYYDGSNQSFLYALAVGQIDATIEGNTVKNVTSTIVDFRGMTEAGNNTFNIRYNTFENAGCDWRPIRIRSVGYDENNATISILVENNKFIDSYNSEEGVSYVNNPVVGTEIYTIGRNYYEIQGVAQTVTKDNFGGAAISVAEAYATASECPGFVVADEVAPTSVTINNKVSELEAFSEYQLVFTVGPENATNKKVGFKSSNAKAATVTSAGVVKVLSEGTTTITVYSMLDNTIQDTFEFTVKAVERIEVRYDGTGVLKLQ